MRVLITGGTGLIGRVTTERLLQHGYDVRILDLTADDQISGAEQVQGNILDYDNLLKHTRGCDAVIHLAALRNPYYAPGPETFQVNVAGTFNVFEAAAANGIRRVVQASSINALGAYYNLVDMDIRYFPIDEAHPIVTTDPYSFSKQVDEDIGAYYWRREGISSVAMRFPGVYAAGAAESEGTRNRVKRAWHILDELVSLPDAEQRAKIASIRQRVLEFRRERPFEYRPNANGQFMMIPGAAEEPLLGIYNGDRFNLWASVDERDAAQSLEKGLTAEYAGAHPLFINAAYNWAGYNTKTLLRLFFPQVTDFKNELPGAASLVSIDRARALIGYEPEYPIQNTASA